MRVLPAMRGYTLYVQVNILQSKQQISQFILANSNHTPLSANSVATAVLLQHGRQFAPELRDGGLTPDNPIFSSATSASRCAMCQTRGNSPSSSWRPRTSRRWTWAAYQVSSNRSSQKKRQHIVFIKSDPSVFGCHSVTRCRLSFKFIFNFFHLRTLVGYIQ